MSALVLAAEAGGSSQTAEQILFWIFAVMAVGAGLAMISMRNIIHAALMLVLNFAAIAGMYLLLETGFLSVVQIIVYAGAIMVLFLFVIMLLGVDRDDLLGDIRGWHKIGAGALALAVLAGTLWAFIGPFTGSASTCNQVTGDSAVAEAGAEPTAPTPQELLDRASDRDVRCTGLEAALAEEENGSVSFVAQRLFTRHTFPFELAGLLLTVATIGAIVLGRRKDLDEDLALLAEPTPQPPGGELAGAAAQPAERRDVGLGSGDAAAGDDAGPAAPGRGDFDETGGGA